jgi:hypothetical protein
MDGTLYRQGGYRMAVQGGSYQECACASDQILTLSHLMKAWAVA